MFAWLFISSICSYSDLAREMSYRSFLLDGVSQSSPSSSHSSTSEDSLNRTPQKKKGIKSSLGKLFSKKDKVKVKEGYGVTSPGRFPLQFIQWALLVDYIVSPLMTGHPKVSKCFLRASMLSIVDLSIHCDCSFWGWFWVTFGGGVEKVFPPTLLQSSSLSY